MKPRHDAQEFLAEQVEKITPADTCVKYCYSSVVKIQ